MTFFNVHCIVGVIYLLEKLLTRGTSGHPGLSWDSPALPPSGAKRLPFCSQICFVELEPSDPKKKQPPLFLRFCGQMPGKN